jgi:hypothetical protein
MKKSELRQLIKEEIIKVLKEENSFNIKLTPKGQSLLSKIENIEEYDDLSREEKLIADIGIYVEEIELGAKFKDLEDFIEGMAEMEYSDVEYGKKHVRNKINRAQKMGLIILNK